MTTHAEILKELHAFRGGEFVPKDGVGVRLESRQIRGGFYWGRGEDYCQAVDAHAHIREAAWKAVRWWIKEKGRDHMGRLMVEELCPAAPVCIAYQYIGGKSILLGYGPDDATALLAAMKFVNGGAA